MKRSPQHSYFLRNSFSSVSFSPAALAEDKPKTPQAAAAAAAQPGRNDEGVDGGRDARRGPQEAGAVRRILHGQDEDVDGSLEAPGRNSGHEREQVGAGRPFRRAARRGHGDGPAVLRHRIHGVRQLQEEVRRLVDGQHGNHDHDLDRHGGRLGKEVHVLVHDGRRRDEEDREGQEPGDDRGRRPPDLRDVEPGPDGKMFKSLEIQYTRKK